MLSLEIIRNNPELVKENIRKKFQEEKIPLVDEIVSKDGECRKLKKKAEDLRAKRNSLSNDINILKKKGKDVKNLINEAKEIPARIDSLERKAGKLHERIREILFVIPNMIHSSVPIGRDHTQNVELKRIGAVKEFKFKPRNHIEIGEKLKLMDFDTSAETSGKGFYFLKGDIARLNMALINFSRDYMIKQGYQYVEPPLMIRKNILTGVYSNAEIDAMSYKIDGEDLYLIATSEHSLIGMFIGKMLKKEELPIKMTGYSMCFRKEIGSHGIEEKGLYRTHQFNKQEMIVICEPNDSYKYYGEMRGHSAALFKKLGIPTRILECCSGDLADLKAKSEDLEAWSPVKKEYYEVTSLTNMEEAQARRLNIRITDGKNKYYAHTLNNTAMATSRALVAMLENGQQKDGSVKIPEALQPYMDGQKVIK